MRSARNRVPYASNGLPPRNCRYGPRAMCAMTSFPSYRDRLIEDDYGLLIDPRYSNPDINEGAPAPGGNYVEGYLSAIGAWWQGGVGGD